MLRKYTSDHDCSLSIAQSSHMQTSSTVIGNCLIDDFRFMSTDHSIPKEIVHKARTNLRVSISYQKALRAKEHIVNIFHGETVKLYALIPRFFDKLVESNPGTCIALEMNDSGHFKFCSMAFASSQDGNNQIFPLAFAIVDSENDASWTWHLSIPKGVLRVFPDVEYCVYTKHLLSNLKLHFKDPLLDKYFFSCAYAYTVEEFEYYMRCMESVCSNIRDYLSSIGFEKWSRAYSRRQRDVLQKWFYERSKAASTMKSHLTSWVENILRLEHEKSRRLLNAHIKLVIPKDARISLVTPKDTPISLVIPKDAHINLVIPEDAHISLVILKDTHIKACKNWRCANVGAGRRLLGHAMRRRAAGHRQTRSDEGRTKASGCVRPKGDRKWVGHGG
ncbi:protein FAR-RED ELONGATED HYPOCOTYL 3-like [Cucumis melo var. makuwa]|uniref:Protein FAR-RED ELONGATED HYPOCOTYL 3-like n=1 Tax=Cucumis melo var. makuwa TaxID=1194695 RepID=A0A5A7UJ33_CUCMM|nr:protein FAR-RED ELONGATED HYPOCOTYL 3-like [Cucumis melo var. makuwa]